MTELIEALKKELAPELERIQLEMYVLGKKDALSTLHEIFNKFNESIFTKELVLGIIDTGLIAIANNRVNE